jgi:hypothetical protein
MATTTQNPPQLALSGESAGLGGNSSLPTPVGKHAVTKGCKCADCEAKRKAWREKDRARRSAAAGSVGSVASVPPVAAPGAPLPSAPSAASAGAPAVGSPAPVPWDSGTLKPLFETLVPECEKWDVSSLKAKAEPLGRAAVELVEREGSWNPVAKKAVIESAPACIANLLNSVGVSAEHAPTVTLLTAAGCILAGRSTLASKIEQLVKERKAVEDKPARSGEGSEGEK